jgi:hypothetical protein
VTGFRSRKLSLRRLFLDNRQLRFFSFLAVPCIVIIECLWLFPFGSNVDCPNYSSLLLSVPIPVRLRLEISTTSVCLIVTLSFQYNGESLTLSIRLRTLFFHIYRLIQGYSSIRFSQRMAVLCPPPRTSRKLLRLVPAFPLTLQPGRSRRKFMALEQTGMQSPD